MSLEAKKKRMQGEERKKRRGEHKRLETTWGQVADAFHKPLTTAAGKECWMTDMWLVKREADVETAGNYGWLENGWLDLRVWEGEAEGRGLQIWREEERLGRRFSHITRTGCHHVIVILRW